MSRGPLSIEIRLRKAQDAVDAAKEKYDLVLSELNRLNALKEKLERQVLCEALQKSGRSYEEICSFLEIEPKQK